MLTIGPVGGLDSAAQVLSYAPCTVQQKLVELGRKNHERSKTISLLCGSLDSIMSVLEINMMIERGVKQLALGTWKKSEGASTTLPVLKPSYVRVYGTLTVLLWTSPH